MAKSLLASGIDPTQAVLFMQSDVPEHTELSWIFTTITPLGDLERQTQFKDKSQKMESIPAGILMYPVLQAADILLYRADSVPVGEDQKQHLELCRDIAIKFNNDYGVDFFPVVEPLIEGAATRVMSLRDGTKKMSKSDPSDQSRINLTDDADEIARKIRKAKTDADPLPDTLDGLKDRPEARNLVNIYAALAGHTPQQVVTDFAGAQFGTFKPALADLAVAKLSPITSEMVRLMKDPGEIDRILGKGADRADAIARPILNQVYDITGMIRSAGRR
jgi:tryptophanyl-tRNA synthetase